MEVTAVAKNVRVQPRKVRIIADEVRGKPAVHSAALLQYHPSKSARLLRKVLVSAMANAQENHQISAESLRIATIMVDEGPRMKRMRARAMGRGFRILKKTSHITVVVEEYEPEVKRKEKSKAKPRPTLAGGKKTPRKKGAEKPIEEIVQPEAAAAEVAEVKDAPVPEIEAAAEVQAEPEFEAPAPEAEAPSAEGESPEVHAEASAEGQETETQAEGEQ